MKDTCVWEQQEWDGDCYSTSCGRGVALGAGAFVDFCITEGTPSEKGFKFCVWCGKAIFEVLIPEDEEGNE